MLKHLCEMLRALKQYQTAEGLVDGCFQFMSVVTTLTTSINTGAATAANHN